MKPETAALRPLAWVLAVLAAAPLVDHAVARAYLRDTANSWAQIGEEMRQTLRRRPALDVLVIGDSSARHAVDVQVLDAALGSDGYNFGAYRPALTGQIAFILDEIAAGRKLSAVVIVTTEHGAMAGFGAQERAVAQNYYRSLRHVLWWRELARLGPIELCDWLFALVSPSFGAGKPLETFVVDAVGAWRAGTLAQDLKKRRAATEKRQSDDALYDGHFALGITPKRDAIARGLTAWRTTMGLDAARPRWRMHADVERAYDVLLDETDRRGVPVFHAFTPRHRSLVEHPGYEAAVRAPIVRWAERMRARHPSFHAVDTSSLVLGDDDFFDTSDHLSRDASKRFSQTLAAQMKSAAVR